MPLNSRDKGNVGQREVISLITPWWRQIEPEALFASTPGSGGWAQGKPGFLARGDIMVDRTTVQLWPWSVEVKREERWSENRLFGANVELRNRSEVWTFWRQCVIAATHDGLRPMLWFRKNRRPWYVALELDFVERMRGLPLRVVLWSIHSGSQVAVVAASDLLTVNPSLLVHRARVDVRRT